MCLRLIVAPRREALFTAGVEVKGKQQGGAAAAAQQFL